MTDRPSDYLFDAACEQWPAIRMMYDQLAEHQPVMLFDIQEQRVYAYPYAQFRKELSERSRRLLSEQYRQAVRENGIVVFVRDNERRRLVSFLMESE